MQTIIEICGWGWTVFALLLIVFIAVAVWCNGKSMKKMMDAERRAISKRIRRKTKK